MASPILSNRIYDSHGNDIEYPFDVNSTDVQSTDIEGGGKVSVGTSAVEATFSGVTSSIMISADNDNTGVLYIGKSDVASAGTNSIAFLNAGESLSMDYNDSTNAIYVIADTTTQSFFKGAIL